MRRREWLFLCLLILSSFAGGYLLRPVPEMKIPTTSPPPKPLSPKPLLCTRPTQITTVHSNCQEQTLSQNWCEMRLQQCEESRKIVRESWPEEHPREAPEQWSEEVSQSLEACGLGDRLETIDCTEYPCLASLRPKDTILNEEQHDKAMQVLMKQVQACEPLREAMGIDEETRGALDVFRLDAPCGDRNERFFALMALDPKGPAYDMLENHEQSDIQDRAFWRWAYRRADDMVATWPCQE